MAHGARHDWRSRLAPSSHLQGSLVAGLLLAGALAGSAGAQLPFNPFTVVDEGGATGADMVVYGPERNQLGTDGFNGFGSYNHKLITDLNGDGVDDLVIGADNSGSDYYQAGRVYVVFGGTNAAGTYNPGGELPPAHKRPGVMIEPYMDSMATGDVNGDGLLDLVIGDGRTNNELGYGDYSQGQVFIVFGRTTPFPAQIDLNLPPGIPEPPGSPQPADVRITPEAETVDFGRRGGLHVADISGDGIDDVLVADRWAFNADGYDYEYGEVQVFNGREDWPADFDVENYESVDTYIYDYDRIGVDGSMHSGDFNGDGFTDVVITSPQGTSSDYYGQGVCYVILGPTEGVPFIDASDPGYSYAYSSVILAPAGAFDVGRSRRGLPGAAVGDFNGDGWDDIALPMRFGEGGGIDTRSYNTEVHVFTGNPLMTGQVLSLEPDSDLNPDDKDFLPPWTAFAVTSESFDLGQEGSLLAGDLNGDGVDELIIGDTYESRGSAPAYSGEVYIILGQKNRTTRVIDTSPLPIPGAVAVPDVILQGEEGGDQLGKFGAMALGDFDGDGPMDLVVAGEFDSPPPVEGGFTLNTGRAYVILGGGSLPTGTLDVATAADAIFEGKDFDDFLGFAGGLLSGDLDADGYGDLVLSSPYIESTVYGQNDTGVAYVYFSDAIGIGSTVRQIDPPEPFPFIPIPFSGPRRQPNKPGRQFVSMRPANNCGCAPLPEIYGSARAVVDFEDGINSSTTTVTLRRNNPRVISGIAPIVGTTWEITTDRIEFTSARVQLHYLDSEIGGLDESQFIIAKAPGNSGPWKQVSPLPRDPVDILLNRVVGEVDGFSTFVLAQAPVLAVDMLDFTASCAAPGAPVELNWSTTAEFDNAGFHVYRALDVDGNFLVGERVTPALVPAQGSQLAGASYTFSDPVPTSAGEVRTYFLSDVALDGAETFHGPASATVPTAASAVNDWTLY